VKTEKPRQAIDLDSRIWQYDVSMPKTVRITTPWPTPEEEASRLRIPKRRQKEIKALAEKTFERMQRENGASHGKVVEKGKKRKHASAAA